MTTTVPKIAWKSWLLHFQNVIGCVYGLKLYLSIGNLPVISAFLEEYRPTVDTLFSTKELVHKVAAH